jgi:hypothetical protein
MKTARLFAAIVLLAPIAAPAVAQQATVRIAIKNHKFAPVAPRAPANQPFTLVVKNLDSTPAEFESKSLRVERIVAAGGEVAIQMRALNAGRYAFFDDFHIDTTEGELIVQ